MFKKLVIRRWKVNFTRNYEWGESDKKNKNNNFEQKYENTTKTPKDC